MMPPGFETKMEIGDVDAEQSSSSISPAPDSPPNHIRSSDTIHVNPRIGGGVVNSSSANSAQSAIAANSVAYATTSNTHASATTGTTGAAPDKPKKTRKKKEVALGADGKPIADDKPKKPRKPREPKDKTAAANGTTTAATRKKPKTEPKAEEKSAQDASAQARQPTITEMVGNFQPPKEPASSAMPQQPQHRSSEGIMRSSLPPATSNPTTPRPVSSGQNYDPIRGSTVDSRPTTQLNAPPAFAPLVNRASASPSIASLIDPPTAMKTSTQNIPHSPTAMQQSFVPSQPRQQSPPSSNPNSAPAVPLSSQESPKNGNAALISNMDGAMDVEPTCQPQRPQTNIPEIKAPSKSSSPGHTPKVRSTPEPPKGTGSGLLSSSDLFGGPSSSEPSERKGVNIDLYIPLNPKGGNTINIAQEIIKKYGRDAINPRAAAHREQLLRIAAEQERLGGISNDDMSVDLLSEVEGDSNVEMGGMDDEKSNTGLDADGKPARKRRKKVEEYDKEDDFIDDTELAWQEQAAVAKDGFFVYSGPLVPEGETPQVESSAPAKGARGRGRGRSGKSTTTGTTHASLADKSRDQPTTTTTTSSTRGRGTRARGTGAARKPRITKAEREARESEKLDRERTAATMKTEAGSNATPASTVAPTPTPAPQLQLASTHATSALNYTAQPMVLE